VISLLLLGGARRSPRLPSSCRQHHKIRAMMVLAKRISLPSILNRQIVEQEEEKRKTIKHALPGGQTEKGCIQVKKMSKYRMEDMRKR